MPPNTWYIVWAQGSLLWFSMHHLLAFVSSNMLYIFFIHQVNKQVSMWSTCRLIDFWSWSKCHHWWLTNKQRPTPTYLVLTQPIYIQLLMETASGNKAYFLLEIVPQGAERLNLVNFWWWSFWKNLVFLSCSIGLLKMIFCGGHKGVDEWSFATREHFVVWWAPRPVKNELPSIFSKPSFFSFKKSFILFCSLLHGFCNKHSE